MARLGVCSWSLQPGSAGQLAERVREAGVAAVQLALDPVRTGSMPVAELFEAFREPRIAILSGMMAMAGEDYASLDSIRRTGGLVPDATWRENLAAAHDNAMVANQLSLDLVTLHAGFIPPDTASPAYAVLRDRLRQVADVFGERGVRVALETGQEDAAGLAELLDRLERPGVGVNFDPANMILYGTGDPVRALTSLLPWVMQVHIKDARPAPVPGTWGTEVPVGDGAVEWEAFFSALRSGGLEVDLVIEREAGEQRVTDVRVAAALVRAYGAAS